MKWFYDMKIGTRLIGTFLLVASIAALVGYVGIRGLGQLAGQAAYCYAHDLVGLAAIDQTSIDIKQASRAEKNLLLASTAEERAKYKASEDETMAVISADMARLKPLLQTPKNVANFARAEEAWEVRKAVALRVQQMAFQEPLPKHRPSADLSLRDGAAAGDAIVNAMDQIAATKMEVAKGRADSTNSEYETDRNLMLDVHRGRDAAWGGAWGVYFAQYYEAAWGFGGDGEGAGEGGCAAGDR